MTVCLHCGRPVIAAAGRWVHLTPSRVGLGPRPSFVTCDLFGVDSVADGIVDTPAASPRPAEQVSTVPPVPGPSPVHPPGVPGTDPL